MDDDDGARKEKAVTKTKIVNNNLSLQHSTQTLLHFNFGSERHRELLVVRRTFKTHFLAVILRQKQIIYSYLGQQKCALLTMRTS